MTTHSNNSIRSRLAIVAALAGLAIATTGVLAQQAATPAKTAAPAKPAGTPGKTFTTPEQAIQAAITAAAAGQAAMLELLGSDAKDLVNSGDAVQDQKDRENFVRMAKEKAVAVLDPADPKRMNVLVGNDKFPLAIPLMEVNGKWAWDVEGGRYEVLVRHVGANELDTIEVCRGYVEAQMQYARMDPGKTGVHQYAQKIISTPGKFDGLYWAGVPESPLTEGVAKALAEGYTSKTQPYHGYYYKVLKAQGAAAPLGEMDFVVQGKMIGGFALVAWPATYRVTGVKTFIVASNGIVYEKDLGADTAKLAAAMTRYNPDKTWTVVEEK